MHITEYTMTTEHDDTTIDVAPVGDHPGLISKVHLEMGTEHTVLTVAEALALADALTKTVTAISQDVMESRAVELRPA